MITAILFDFFGTLVEYSPSRVEQGYHATHELLLNEGVDISYAAFLENWVAVSEALDRWSQSTGLEYSMEQVALQFIERVCPHRRSREFSTRLWMSYLEEWSTAIRYIPGVRELMQELSARFRLGVVTNTHYAPHIHAHLRAMGISQHMAVVVTSIEHGRPKPHPSIFMSALERLDCAASATLFVGDSYDRGLSRRERGRDAGAAHRSAPNCQHPRTGSHRVGARCERIRQSTRRHVRMGVTQRKEPS